MILREPCASDIGAIVSLLGQLGYQVSETEIRERFGHVIRHSGHRVRVAEKEGRVVGLIHVFERPALEKPREAVVQALVVEAGLRGGGVGAALMRDAEAWALARGLPSMSLYTGVGRAGAHSFYERLDYRQAGTSHLMRRAF